MMTLHVVVAGRRRSSCAPRAVSMVAIALVAMALAGCAGTQLQRAERLGALGKAYADAVAATGNEALDSSIAFSLDELVKERRGGMSGSDPAQVAARDKAIKDQIETLKQRQDLVAQSNQQLALLGAYFEDLEAFAKQDVGKQVETATGGLTESINRVGKAIEGNPQAKATLTPAEGTAIAKLAGLVAHQIHGQALARTLERDAPMIGTQLRLMSKVLATYSEWIRTRTDFELADHYRNKVIKPFVAPGEVPSGWERDVRRYLAGATYAAQLGKAHEAAERMERFWAGYLAGASSIAGLIADLKEVRELLEAITAYRNAQSAGG